MEENQHNDQQNIHEFFKKIIFERDEQIRKLEGQLSEQPELENVWKDKYFAALDAFDEAQKEDKVRVTSLQNQVDGLNDLIKKIRAEKPAHKRQNKTGNLLWTLAFCALGGLFGFFIHKWFYTPKDNHALVFQKFKDENQFNFEFDLSQGRIADVEEKLATMMTEEANQQLMPEIEFTKKLLGAARRKFEEQGFKPEKTGIAIEAPSDEPIVVEEKLKTLSITEKTLTIRAEATTKSDKIGKLQKGDQVTILDKTDSYDKLSMTIDGKEATIRDYWYRIETKDHLEGWVFGYFTTRSRKKVEFTEPEVTEIVQPAETPIDTIKK